MESSSKHGPQYPAQGGAKISGDPAHSVAAQGAVGGLATGDPDQDVAARGILVSMATGDQQQLTGVTPVEHPGLTCQPAGERKPPRRRKKKRAVGDLLAAGSSVTVTATASSLAQSPAAESSGETATDMEMVIGRSDSSEEVVPAPGSARQVDSSEQEIRTEQMPSCSGAAVAGDPAAMAADRKRKSEVGPTPPQSKVTKKKKVKRKPAAGAYFSQAEQTDLLGVVLVRGQPYAVLDRALVAHLRELVSQRVREAVRAKGFVPTFNEAGIRNNRFQIACCNRDSYIWLERVIKEIELTHIGAEGVVRLCLVPPDAVPKLIRAAVYAPGVPSAPDFLELIQGQNPGLFTERWVLRHRQTVGNSTLLVFGIDGDSASILAGSNYSAHYELCRVTFQVSRAQAGGEGSSHE